jgi:hypothetical protein
MRYAAAGHPPPMVRLPDGGLLDLDRAQGAALGLRSRALRPTGTVELPPGSLLAAFTDGLVERCGEDWDTSVGRIRQAVFQPCCLGRSGCPAGSRPRFSQDWSDESRKNAPQISNDTGYSAEIVTKW